MIHTNTGVHVAKVFSTTDQKKKNYLEFKLFASFSDRIQFI